MTDSADCAFSFFYASVFFLFSFFFAPHIVFAQPLCTCHSKRPATVAMHQAVKGRNCFSCHVRGERLRKKGGIPPEKHAEFLRRRTKEPQCLECHGKDDSVKDAAGSGDSENSTGACPRDLVEAGNAYISELQLFQNKIRQSNAESPLGVQQTMQFDRAAHSCHGGPAQAVKDFGMPRCISSDKEGSFILKYPYQVHYRQAATVQALYEAPWEKGSDGFLLVEFLRENEKWKVAGERESIK